jgi:sRNA-binding regulator protein Hfq
MDRNKPIYSRPVVGNISSNVQPPKPAVKFTPEEIERKQSQHDDQWLHDRRGKSVTVKFLDGEQLSGTILNIRKFHFSLATDFGLNMMIYKVGVKYVYTNETESGVR